MARVGPGVENDGMRVYLDHAATTPVDPRVVEAMEPCWNGTFGNASSLHAFGRDAEDLVEIARLEIARTLGARPRELVFTSGGTESANLALRGVLAASRHERPGLVVSAVEHPAVLRPAEELDRAGLCDLVRVPVDREGLVDPASVREAMTKRTALVSVMTVNNETGAIQPVKEIASICREHEVPFHTDAVQALGKIPVDVSESGADLVSFSAHKVHGPKGVGALWVRRGIRLEPLLHGGEQERGLRPGTLPVPLIVGFGEAARLLREEFDDRRTKAARLGSWLLEGLETTVEGVRLNGPRERRVPHTVNVCLPGTTGESLLIRMDRDGVAVSTGSACASGTALPSHVLLAMGLSKRDAQSSLRLSLSHHEGRDQLEHAVRCLATAVEKIRAMARGRRR
jgi:cysteine desulfurase